MPALFGTQAALAPALAMPALFGTQAALAPALARGFSSQGQRAAPSQRSGTPEEPVAAFMSAGSHVGC